MITKTDNGFLLDNHEYSRRIVLDERGLRTVSVLNKSSGTELWKDDVADFELIINDKKISSLSGKEVRFLDGNVEERQNDMTFLDYEIVSGSDGGETLKLKFAVTYCDALLTACYESYSDLSGTVKYLEIKAGSEDLAIRCVTIERLSLCPGEFNQIEYYKEHGTQRINSNNFVLSGTDDILQMHNPELEEGLFIGNGAPPPLRNFLVYPHWGWGISCGYSMGNAEFNKYLSPGEKFISDRIYLSLYQGARNDRSAANQIREMIRRDLPQLNMGDDKVMYCTWLPFLKNINTELLLDLAERAAALGFLTFVVDDGWFTDNYQVDTEKFPNGLEEVVDKVRHLGMKFGLWFNIGTDYGEQGSHPENNAVKSDASPKGGSGHCRCFASSHREFIVVKLIQLAEQYQVDYFKLDFSTICSPYGFLTPGCQSIHHAYHRDGTDAVVEQYESMAYVRNELKKRFPPLIVDFSFEVFGAERPSISALRFSELHHSSNMNTLRPKYVNSFNIRNTLYSYCGLLPSERILGSLICLQDEGDIESLLSALIGAPLVAGDLRKISSEGCSEILKITSTLNHIAETGIMTILEILHPGNEPLNRKYWDGYCRFNKTGNGLLAAFANQYKGPAPTITLSLLPENIASFTFCDILSETDIGVYSREQLMAGVQMNLFQDKHIAALRIKPVSSHN
jgi:melibiase-like protein